MYDYVKVAIKADALWVAANGRTEPYWFNNTILNPVYNIKTGILKNFTGIIRGMVVKAYRDVITLENSLHKAFHGNNHSIFTLSECSSIINTISQETGLDWNNAIVKKIEYGCNIYRPELANIYKCLSFYKHSPFRDMPAKVEYGRHTSEMQLYKIKCYNKTIETLINDKKVLDTDIARWEVAVKYLHYFQNASLPQIYQLKDLLNQDNALMLADDLVNKFAGSTKTPLMDVSNISGTNNLKVLGYMQVPECVKKMRNEHKSTFKKDLAYYNNFIKGSGELYDLMESEIKNYCYASISN